MKRAIPITTLFLDIGGVLLTNGWDHHARRRAATNFQLNLAEMEDRHHLTFDTYEEGKLTLEEYLSRVVFYQKRAFSRDQFRRFMFAQSKPFPKMIELIRRLKARYGLKIVVVSNEARDLNAHRIQRFKLADLWIALFLPASFMSVNLTRTSSDLRWTSPRRRSGKCSTSITPRCLSRSQKVWVFEASITRSTGPPARS